MIIVACIDFLSSPRTCPSVDFATDCGADVSDRTNNALPLQREPADMV